MNPNAAIHVAKKQLGLDDDSYRAINLRITGKESSKDMTPNERGAVLAEMRRLGFVPTPPASRSREIAAPAPQKARRARGALSLEGPYVAKMRALWISGWNLGVVRDRTDEALAAFVRRQTGVDHVSWVRDPVTAAKAIEALKGWLAREAGVIWPTAKVPFPHESKRAIIEAQLRRLGRPADSAKDSHDLDGVIAELGKQIQKVAKS